MSNSDSGTSKETSMQSGLGSRFYYIYAMSMTLIAGIYLLIGASTLSWSIIQTIAPEFTISEHENRKHASNTFYCEQAMGFCRTNNPGQDIKTDPPTTQEITQQREASWKVAVHSERRNGLKNLIMYGIGCIVAGLFFFSHRRILKRRSR
jgi:hypothetical protein